MPQDIMQDLLNRCDKRKTAKAKDSKIFYSKSAVMDNSQSWCFYCLSGDVPRCLRHQFYLTTEELADIEKKIKNGEITSVVDKSTPDEWTPVKVFPYSRPE
jgi:hypothetical protein